MTDHMNMDSFGYFSAMVNVADAPEFLDVARTVCLEQLTDITAELDEVYPVRMTRNLFDDPRLEPLVSYLGETGWNILSGQGYRMADLHTYFTEMWCQEHHKHSSMEQHVHPNTQIVGFYFLDTPENCSRAVFHDPVPGRAMSALPEIDPSAATLASTAVNFIPRPGMVIFTNSWLPHSFTRHGSDEPMRFIHFNLNVRNAPPSCSHDVEIV